MNSSKTYNLQYLIMGILAITVIIFGAYALNIRSQALEARESQGTSSDQAVEQYFKDNETLKDTKQLSSSGNTTKSTSTTQSTAVKASTSKIVGNTNTSVKPPISKNVAAPTSSIQSISTFFTAIKNEDFQTANALMGPVLASQIASITNTQDPQLALSACHKDNLCSLILNSFNPPANGKYSITTYKSNSGNKGERVSFKLSDSSNILAQQVGDHNIDIFSEEYAGGIWVIQAIYIDGSSVNDFI